MDVEEVIAVVEESDEPPDLPQRPSMDHQHVGYPGSWLVEGDEVPIIVDLVHELTYNRNNVEIYNTSWVVFCKGLSTKLVLIIAIHIVLTSHI